MMTKGGILDAMAKPEFAHGMAQIGAGTQNFENLFRPANNQIQVQQPDPFFLEKKAKIDQELQAAKQKAADDALRRNMYAGLFRSSPVAAGAPDDDVGYMPGPSPAAAMGLNPQQQKMLEAAGPSALPELLKRALQPKYETVNSPYGFGGAAQRDPVTNELTNYQPAPKPPTSPAPSSYQLLGPVPGVGNKGDIVTGQVSSKPGTITIGTPAGNVQVPTSQLTKVSPQGGRDELGLQTKTKATIEEQLRVAQEGLVRLDDVAASFRPEFLEIGTRLAAQWSSIRAKLGKDLSPKDRKLLEDISVFKRNAWDNLNRYIKDITGAQMSEPEAERILKGAPNPGKGVFDGDDPIEFESKMRATIRSLSLATARYAYSLKKGLNPLKSGISLNGMKSIMARRANQLKKEIRVGSPSISDAALKKILRQRIADEFGIIQ